MKKIHALIGKTVRSYLPGFLILFCLSCDEKTVEPTTTLPEVEEKPVTPEKEIPKGAKKQTIEIDDAYDLSATYAVSAIDSTSMNSEKPSLLVSNAERSVAFFVEKGTYQVMAVVRTTPQSGGMAVNAQTVTEGLYDMLPAYHSLTPAVQKKFEAMVVNTDSYKSFVMLVDERLKNKKPVYAADVEYLKALRGLNLVITDTYFKDANKGGRSTTGSRTSDDMPDITTWLVAENNTLENQLHSYVDVFLTSATPNESRELNMGPRNFILASEAHNLSQFPDSYYSLRITQVTEKARKENLAGAVSKAVGMVVGALFGESTNGCAGDLSVTLSGDLISLYTADKLNTTPEEDLTNLYNIAGNAAQTVFAEEKCYVQLFSKALLSKISVLSQLWKLGWIASDAIQVANFLKGLKNHNDIVANIQLYQGKLIMGQASIAPYEQLKESYKITETVPVTVAINGDNAFNRAGFKIEWITDVLSGSASPLQTTTNENGKATAQWKMPKEYNDIGVDLIANLKDKEGDHLKGSPVKFSSTLEKVVYTVAGFSFDNIGDIGTPCPDMPKSCSYGVNINFANPVAPSSGTILYKTIWDADGDGYYEGNLDGNFGVLEINGDNDTPLVTMRAGFCWGRDKTQLRFQVKYKAKDGTESPLVETGIPKY